MVTSTSILTIPVSTALIPALAGGLAAAMLCVIVAHGILRPLLEARGITPWTVRDSLGSLPLVLIGSALTVGTTIYLVVGDPASARLPVRVLCLALLCAGLLMVRLGLLALRKLT